MAKQAKDKWVGVLIQGAVVGGVITLLLTVLTIVVAAHESKAQAREDASIPVTETLLRSGSDSIREFDHDGMHYTVLVVRSTTQFVCVVLRTEPVEEYEARQAAKKQD